ncbi:alanine glycine permease [Deinococcus piscis]|uniref:Alanine glycine permease n=1 Tax=Deinococcus piscis TaxID=394230 RepID=A0ABQ3KC29_9DEIO|nr:alanine/glycine:cation symporter family protein [Deinococcus piscis]GHG11623.1 alanine glycine permease [Deinococcus piscis]
MAESFDARINAALTPISNAFSSVIFYSVPIAGTSLPLIVVWLLAASIFFTLRFKFINLRMFRHGIDLVRGRYSSTFEDSPGQITHFQALTTAVSGTVGLGNIAGVAVAIGLGGPGATFWMILAGLLGMSTKFVECTLGVKYRRINEDGTVSGGPMYYLKNGLNERGLGKLGRVLAILFAVGLMGGALGGGNMFQSNQAFAQLLGATGGDASPLQGYGWAFGLVLAGLVAAVIFGGVSKIAAVTSRLVPFMAGLYILTIVYVLTVNASAIPGAFSAILTGAFSPQGITGGIIGVMIQGIRRATFSNEAGIGAAAVAHSAVKTSRPITEGFVALLEPFIDTVLVCTMTALALIVTGVYDPALGYQGVQMTDAAFRAGAPWFSWILTISVVLFAFSTILGYAYYGQKATGYLFGESVLARTIFRIVFLMATVVGATMSLGAVVDLSDSLLFFMSIPNIIGLYLLTPVVKRELDQYMTDLRSGAIPKYRHGVHQAGD